MIKPEMIPPEAVEAAAKVLHANAEIFHDILWDDLGEYDQDAYREEATSALLAAMNAWPNQNIIDDDVVYVMRAIMLPLTQENVQNAGR